MLLDYIVPLSIMSRDNLKNQIMLNPIPPRLLSISKSRAIRLLFLALLNNTDVVIRRILAEHRREDLPDDVLRMLDACRFWSNHIIPVGESATVLRFLWWFN